MPIVPLPPRPGGPPVRAVRLGEAVHMADGRAGRVIECPTCKGVGLAVDVPAEVPDRPARARATDPGTSHAAAASLTEDSLSASRRAVLAAVRRFGPCTDEKLVDLYIEQREIRRWPRQTAQSIRSRRSELAAAGFIVNTGERARLTSGRDGTVWAATSTATIATVPAPNPADPDTLFPL